MGQAEENHVWLLGINVSSKPRWLQLLICGGGFFFGYMVNGVCEVRKSSAGKCGMLFVEYFYDEYPSDPILQGSQYPYPFPQTFHENEH
jgi:hypothetical protein